VKGVYVYMGEVRCKRECKKNERKFFIFISLVLPWLGAVA